MVEPFGLAAELHALHQGSATVANQSGGGALLDLLAAQAADSAKLCFGLLNFEMSPKLTSMHNGLRL